MFTESNTVEALVRDLLCGSQPTGPKGLSELPVPYIPAGLAHRGAGWHYVPAAALPRQPQDVFVEVFDRRVTSPARVVTNRVVRGWRRARAGDVLARIRRSRVRRSRAYATPDCYV